MSDTISAESASGTRSLADRARGAVRWETGLAVVVLLIVIVGSAASPDFLTGNNLFNLGLSNGEMPST